MADRNPAGPDRERTVKTLDALAEAYLRQNVERKSEEAQRTLEFVTSQLPDLKMRLENAEQARPLRFNLLVEARKAMQEPVFNFHCLNVDGHWVFAFSKGVEDEAGSPRGVERGERIRLVAEIDNQLVPGRYSMECWISRSGDGGSLAIFSRAPPTSRPAGRRAGPASPGRAAAARRRAGPGRRCR